MPSRRSFLAQGGHTCAAAVAVATLPIAVAGATSASREPSQRFVLVGLVGSENPTRANFRFAWANALKEAGHEVRIELAGTPPCSCVRSSPTT